VQRAINPAAPVSIVVPFLDAERFLREAIESVRAQTYADWELLLVDDGSRDASKEIALSFARRDPGRISYLRHDGGGTRGLAATRNLGIEHARGDFVAFLDADDVWLPGKLEQQTAILAAQPHAAMVYGASEWWYSWSGIPEDRERDYVEPLGVPTDVILTPPSLLRRWFVRQDAAIPNPTNILVRRSLVEDIGGFEEGVPLYEDQTLYAKACVHGAIYVAGETWDRYRQHPHSLTAVARRSGTEAKARARFLNWLIAYLSEHGIDGDIRAALTRQRILCAHPWLDRVAKRVHRGA
jgi:glycosyltransferase involved in cell wall biosynthesis